MRVYLCHDASRGGYAMLTWEGQTMRERLIVNGLCLLIALAALGYAGWGLFTGQIWIQGVDGLFLILISLFIAFLFALNPLLEIKRNGLQGLLGSSPGSSPARAEATASSSKEITMVHAPVHEYTDVGWGGAALPYAIGSKKLGMWLFIVSDSLTFAALLFGYSYVRISTPDWPTPFHFNPSIIYATVMTFFLLLSSVTMALAVREAGRGNIKKTALFILATIGGGAMFIILHANEWNHLIHEGVRMFRNPWGVPLFGATFFTLTGLHMLHVASGLVYLLVIMIGFSRRKFSAEDVEISGLYWHFVDLVWMFIFPLVYLLSVKME